MLTMDYFMSLFFRKKIFRVFFLVFCISHSFLQSMDASSEDRVTARARYSRFLVGALGGGGLAILKIYLKKAKLENLGFPKQEYKKRLSFFFSALVLKKTYEKGIFWILDSIIKNLIADSYSEKAAGVIHSLVDQLADLLGNLYKIQKEKMIAVDFGEPALFAYLDMDPATRDVFSFTRYAPLQWAMVKAEKWTIDQCKKFGASVAKYISSYIERFVARQISSDLDTSILVSKAVNFIVPLLFEVIYRDLLKSFYVFVDEEIERAMRLTGDQDEWVKLIKEFKKGLSKWYVAGGMPLLHDELSSWLQVREKFNYLSSSVAD